MNNVNSSALLRTLVVYAICIPLAILVGYLLTDPLDSWGTIAMEGAILGFLVFPILIKFHYPLLVFSWSLPVTLFFLPGHPSVLLVMVVTSLTISIIEKILDRNAPRLPVPSVRWPLIAFLVVIFITAKLTGGFGLRSMGSEVYGGRKYVMLVIGILTFFAFSARPIPKKHAKLYISLFFVGGLAAIIQDFYSSVPGPLKYIYLLIPPVDYNMMGSSSIELGRTRLVGASTAGAALFYWLLARNGFRENLLTPKLWRPALLGFTIILIFLGGYRSAIIAAFMTMAVLFYLEKLHRTGLMLIALMLSILGGALIVPLAPHLPYTFQRSLAFLPVNISNEARMDAQDSSDWRVNMWEALLPQVPKYLLLGKGYAFSQETFNESIGRDAAFRHSIDAAENPLALAGDFHNGPLSIIISLGIWGVLAWLSFWIGGFFVVWRNYRYGDPDLSRINTFLFAFFVSKCVMFAFVVGSMTDDIGAFGSLVGLSVAFNHGVRTRKTAAAAVPARTPSLRAQTPGASGLTPRAALPGLSR